MCVNLAVYCIHAPDSLSLSKRAEAVHTPFVEHAPLLWIATSTSLQGTQVTNFHT